MNAPQQSLELETLRHRVRIAELLHKETKLKAQRMALQAAFYERAYKQATAEGKAAEQVVVDHIDPPPSFLQPTAYLRHAGQSPHHFLPY